MRLHPKTLKAGFIDEVSFGPRVKVRRIWTPSVMPFAAKVLKIACLMNARVGTLLKAFEFNYQRRITITQSSKTSRSRNTTIAFDESSSRCRCSSNLKTVFLYTRRPSQTASDSKCKESKVR